MIVFRKYAIFLVLSVFFVLFFTLDAYSDSSLVLTSKTLSISINITYDSLKREKNSIILDNIKPLYSVIVDGEILVFCIMDGSCTVGLPGDALNYIANTGIVSVSETCFPYETSDSDCLKKYGISDELIRSGGKTKFYGTSEEELKKLIIKGPVSFGLYSWSHAIGLVGYKTIKEGDKIYVQSNSEDK